MSKPFINWVGGKTQLLKHLTPLIPQEYNHYYEPFIGGGALFLHLNPIQATINDTNTELVEAYRTIKQHPQAVINAIQKLDSHDKTQEKYLHNREVYNHYIQQNQQLQAAQTDDNTVIQTSSPTATKNALESVFQALDSTSSTTDQDDNALIPLSSLQPEPDITLSLSPTKETSNTDWIKIYGTALLIWLNKNCFNGLYRTNQKGLFNASWGKYDKPSRTSVNPANIHSVSQQLQHTTILRGDFQAACENIGQGDLLFLDSPYDLLNKDTFVRYGKDTFTEQDHRRVAETFINAAEKGAHVIATNHNTALIRDLYRGYSIQEVDVKRLVNTKASARTGKEVIITANIGQ